MTYSRILARVQRALPGVALSALASTAFGLQEPSYLVAGDGRFAEIDRRGTIRWEFPCEPTAASVLANGNLWLLLPNEARAELARFGRGFVWRSDVDGPRERIPQAVELVRLVVAEGKEPSRLAAEFGADARVWRLASAAKDATLVKARRIHWSTLTLDTHKDIRDTLAAEAVGDAPVPVGDDPRRWGPHQVDFQKMRAGGLDCAFYIVYVGQGPLTEEGYARAKTSALAKFDAIERQARRFPDDIVLARTPDEVERAHAEGKLSSCIGVENGYAMGEDLALVAEFHRRGARYMSLTHNGHSQLGDSNTPEEALYGGLSDLGRRAIEEMNRVGIMVDVSHSGRATMLQAVEHSKAPVLASHSGARALCDHTRNLDDEQMRALAAKRGVMQCVAFDSYVVDGRAREEAVAKAREELGLQPRQRFQRVDPNEADQAKLVALRQRVAEIEAQHPHATVKDFVDHIHHAVEVMGIDFVAISSDFDGGGGIEGWNDASETFNVTLELVRRGYDAEAIGKLWSGNTLRLWREVEALAAR